MPLDWAPFVDFVDRHQRFLIMTHVRPDGDALGSEAALAEALRLKGKSARAVVASGISPRYDFLDPGKSRFERFIPPGDAFRNVDAVIIIDTGTWNQIGEFGDFLKTLSAARAVIDHHRTQDDLGAVRFVDTSAEAAGRLAYEAIRAMGVALTPQIANALFLALATDTGWFRHASTSPATFALAGELVQAGAQPTMLYDALYERNPFGRLKLLGLALDRLRLVENGRVAYSEIFIADFAATDSTPADTEDLINYPRSVEGVEVALIFIEQRGGTVKVSFRSRDRVDVDKLAEKFGGGGHRLAAGATIKGQMEEVRSRVLFEVGVEVGREE